MCINEKTNNDIWRDIWNRKAVQGKSGRDEDFAKTATDSAALIRKAVEIAGFEGSGEQVWYLSVHLFLLLPRFCLLRLS